MYTFIVAIPLPFPIKKTLQMLCCGLPGVEWAEEESFHLPLLTIRSKDNSLSLDLCDILKETSFPPTTLALLGVDIQHTKSNRGSIWARITPLTALQRFSASLEHSLHRLKLNAATIERVHQPRIFLGNYNKLPPHRAADYLQAHSALPHISFEVSSLVLLYTPTSSKVVLLKLAY